MAYVIKEIHYTLQGEGAQTGRAAVFCRFAGCNLWSGREEDRATAQCGFCDTDFAGIDGPGGGCYDSADALAEAILARWPAERDPETRPYVVCTGGEPLLQLDAELIGALHRRNAEIAVETNGALAVPEGIDWICVSPKTGVLLAQKSGDELKLAFPQPGAEPRQYEDLDFQHFFVQPIDGPNLDRNTRKALRHCLEHPRWKLSLQMHKILGIP